MDEYTLTSAFPEKETARKYLEHHYDTFVTKQDVGIAQKVRNDSCKSATRILDSGGCTRG